MNGLVLLDKPEGFTSFKAAAALRRIYEIKRVGHTGTLDPMATGVLPVLIGGATKLCSLVLEADKKYTAGVRLGITTDTLDITGTVKSECTPRVSDEELSAALIKFTGTYDQIPPMYSAIKIDGKKLCNLARNGIEVEREPRRITVRSIEIKSRNQNDFVINVLCTKGTYIRSLVDDIGRYLGCGAVLTSLRRTTAAQFSADDCATLEEINSDPGKYLLPSDRAVDYLRKFSMSEGQKKRFTNGAELFADRLELPENIEDGELFRAYFDGEFFGVAEFISEDGIVKPKCLIV